jgi:hypothetical protein
MLSRSIVIAGVLECEWIRKMPSKPRKPKPFRATSAVKAASRAAIGAPPPTRAEPGDKKKLKTKAEKHKPTLSELLTDRD